MLNANLCCYPRYLHMYNGYSTSLFHHKHQTLKQNTKTQNYFEFFCLKDLVTALRFCRNALKLRFQFTLW